jgi:hypothetical protein
MAEGLINRIEVRDKRIAKELDTSAKPRGAVSENEKYQKTVL